MNCRTILSLVAALVGVLAALSGSASATTLTSPSGTTYTGTSHASAGTTVLHGEAFSVSCKSSTVHGSVSQHGTGVTVKGSISTLDFSECSFPVTVLANGSLEMHEGQGANHFTLTSSGAKITIHGPFGINCLYETSNTDIGTLTGGTTAKLDIDSSLIPRTGDSAFCGAAGEWTGSYTVSTPDTLLADA